MLKLNLQLFSGGAYDYLFGRIQSTYEGKLKDPLMEELLKDFVKVLYELEWCDSGDTTEDRYRKELDAFKEKWIKEHDKEVE